MNKLLVIMFLITLLITRFYNLDHTARFTRDESYDIVKLHQYWVEKKVTLVGAINVTNELVYSSLTYYMLMPFAILGDFEPVSPVYGVAFYGTLTVLIFLLIVRKLNKKMLYLAVALVLVWFPLVQSSRWSWNPHLVTLWTSLGMLSFLQRKKVFLFLSGVFFGLAFHNHYLSFVSVAVFLIPTALVGFFKKEFLKVFTPWIGFVFLLIPFAVFDIRHPPGLFFTGYLKSNMVSQGVANEFTSFPKSFVSNIYNAFFYLTQYKVLAIFTLSLSTLLAYLDVRKKRYSHFLYLFPVVAQVAIISFLPTYENRYFLLTLTFLFVWLVLKREGISGVVLKLIILLFIVGGTFSLPGALTKPLSQPPPYVVSGSTNYIKNQIEKNDMKNVNIASLQSPDPDPLGLIYRDVLLSKNIRVLQPNEYTITDNLFITTTSAEEEVRNDPANIMNGFREGKLVNVYDVLDSNWKVYLFNRE